MLNIKWDITNYEETSKLYAYFWKKLPAELVTKECRDIAIKALTLTPSVPKPKVEQELEAPSRINPKEPLKAVLAGWESRKTGKNITAAQLKRKRINSTNAVRAGWINGARQFKELNKGGGFVPRLRTSKKMGGGTLNPPNPATLSTTSTGKVFNSFGDEKVKSIQRKFLEQAKRFLAADRAVYCLRQLVKIKNKIGAWK
jgi:hypothetical protein